jgi:hypothetical protein
MTDTSYVRVYNGGGIAASTSGDIHAAYFQKSDYAQTGYIDWGRTQLLVSNEGGYGGNAWAGISYWAAGANVAPQITCLGNGGERMGVLNGPGNAYAPIAASAFPVISSLRFKTDVRDLGDDELIGHVRKVRGIHFLPKVRPQNVRPNDRFNKANKRWQEHGHSPLRVTPQHTVMGDHDCDLDPCPGTRDDPCHIALSDTHKFGLSAEALYEVLPELVELDQDRKPEMINVDQIAALALAAVGALARRIEALEAPATKTPAKKTVAKKTTPVKKAQ